MAEIELVLIFLFFFRFDLNDLLFQSVLFSAVRN